MNIALDRFSQTAGSDHTSFVPIAELSRNLEAFFQPEMQDLLHESLQAAFRHAVSQGVLAVFAAVLAASVCCLICCVWLPADSPDKTHPLKS